MELSQWVIQHNIIESSTEQIISCISNIQRDFMEDDDPQNRWFAQIDASKIKWSLRRISQNMFFDEYSSQQTEAFLVDYGFQYSLFLTDNDKSPDNCIGYLELFYYADGSLYDANILIDNIP